MILLFNLFFYFIFLNITIKASYEKKNIFFKIFFDITNNLKFEVDQTQRFFNISIIQNKKYILQNIASSDFKNCSLCKQVSSIKGNSKSTDLILSFLYGNGYNNILTFIRSLRTTKSKAIVIFFATSRWLSICPTQHLQEFKKCGGILIDIGKEHFFDQNPLFLRFYLYKLFIRQYIFHFNRVILCDVFDTFFQKDPFNSEFPEQFVYSTIENQDLTRSINGKWIKETDPNFKSYDFYKGKYVLCLGFIYGGIHSMNKLLNLFINLNVFKRVQRFSNDQSLFNYLYYQGDFKNLLKLDMNGNIVSATLWTFKNNPNNDGLMVVTSLATNAIPSAIHQYDRVCPLRKFIEDLCPALGSWHSQPYAKYQMMFQRCSLRE